MKKKFVLVLLALIFFLGAVGFYVNRVILPIQVKHWVSTKAEQTLRRKIKVGSIHFHWLKGLIIEDVRVYEPQSEKLFVHAESAVLRIFYFPILFEQKIIIPQITLVNPSVNLVRTGAQEWNFSDLLNLETGGKKSPFKFFLKSFTLDNGTVRLVDKTHTPYFIRYAAIHLKGTLSLSHGLNYQFSSRIREDQAEFSINGHISLKDLNLKSEIAAKNIPAGLYLHYYPLPGEWVVNSAHIPSVQISLSRAGDQWSFSGAAGITALDALRGEDYIRSEQLTMDQMHGRWMQGAAHIEGKIKSTGTNLKAGRFLFAGDASLSADRLNYNAGALQGAGSVSTHTMVMTLPVGQTFKGGATISNLDFAYHQDFETTFNILAEDLSIEFSNGSVVSGHWDAKPVRVTRKDGNLKTEAGLTLNNGTYTTPSGHRFQANVVSPVFIAARPANGRLHITGGVEAGDALLTLSDGKKISGQAASKRMLIMREADHWKVQCDLTVGDSVFDFKTSKLTGDLDLPQLDLKIFSGKTNLLGTANLANGKLYLTKDRTITASPSFGFNAQYTPDSKTPWIYETNLNLKDAKLEGFQYNPTGVTGTIAIGTNKAASEKLNLMLFDMPIELSGTVRDYKQPDLNVKTNVAGADLVKVQKLFPQIFKRFGMTVQRGNADLKIAYQGPLPLRAEQLALAAQLTNTDVYLKNFEKSVRNLNGGIDYKKDILVWKDLNGTLDGKSYKATGQLAGFDAPSVQTTVESDTFKASLDFSRLDNEVNIKNLSGSYLNSRFNVTGKVLLAEDGDPLLDMQGHGTVKLNELGQWWRLAAPYKLDGVAGVDLAFKGRPKKFKHARLSLKAESPSTSIHGYQVKDVKLSYEQDDLKVRPLTIDGKLYDGNVSLIANANLAREGTPFEAALRLENLNIAKLIKDTPLKDKKFNGDLSTTVLTRGHLEPDWRDLEGKGAIIIRNGYLWELDLLRGLKAILLIPEYSEIVFTESGMNFEIKDRQVTTQNIQLVSEALTLVGQGSLGFDGTLNVDFEPDFNPELIQSSFSMKRGPTAIIASTQEYISVSATGNIKKPQFSTKRHPMKIIKNAGKIFFQNLKEIPQTIF